jgi:hypothetical protein
MGLLRLLRRLSLLLGAQREFVRRLGGVALVFMGVHAAADVLDDVAADVIDVVDLFVDDVVAAVLGWLSVRGAIAPDAAVQAIEDFSAAVELAQKQWLALRAALVIELALDLLLFDLCWGSRPAAGASRGIELRETTRELVRSLRSIDLERLVAPGVLIAFALSGAFVASTACEQPLGGLVAMVPGALALAGNAGAALAMMIAGLLVVRFVPDLLHGAVVRAHERGEHARTQIAQRRQRRPARVPAVGRAIDELRRVLRGSWLALALYVAVAGLRELDVVALLMRLQAAG